MAGMTKPRLFIIDPQLKNYQGHHFEYCQSVAEAAKRQGWEPVVFANKGFAITDTGDVPYQPVFRHGQFDRQPNSWRLDMMRALDAAKVSAADHIFIHTIYMPELQQLLAIMEFYLPKSAPHWHIVLRRDLEEYTIAEKYFMYNFYRAIAATPAFAEKVHFYGDTKELCDQYNAYAQAANMQVAQLPIPQRHELLGAVETATKPADAPLVIAYLGDARNEKGYHFLPEAVAHVLRTTSRKVKFVLQSGFNIPGGEPGVKEAFDKLRAMPNVECPVGPFSAPEYYGLLKSADIVVLPYNAQLYKRRSSGPLSEAIATGKVAVVPGRCWLSGQIDETRGVTFDAYSQLGAAICTAIDKFDALQPAARAFAQQYRAHNTPDALVKFMQGEAAKPWRQRPASTGKRKVLMVCEAWVADLYTGSGQGSGSSHMRFFRDLDAEVHLLVRLDLFAHQFPSVDIEQYLRCQQFCETFGAASLSFAWYPAGWSYGQDPESRRLATTAMLEMFRDNDLMTDLRIREEYIIDPSFVDFVKATRFDFVVLHYARNMPLLDKLELHGAPVICETHDDMCLSKAIMRNDAAIDPEEEALEGKLLSKCQGIICVNDEETQKYAKQIPGVPSRHLVPVIARKPDPEHALAGCITLLDGLQAAGARDVYRVQQLIKQLEGQLRIDLFMVSSNHALTVKSLVQFYNDVFVPYLKPRNIRLTIAGAILRPREIKETETHVQFLGRVDDLSPLYAMSSLIILPIHHGTGVGIKTLEALGYKQPLLGTRLAFRGVSQEFLKAAEPLICEDAKTMATRIVEVLDNPAKREANRQQVIKLAQSVPSWATYSEGFSSLLRDVAPKMEQPKLAVGAVPPEPAPFEIDDHIVRFNMMLRLVLLGGVPPAQDSQLLATDLKNPALRARFAHMFESFFVARTAPLARIFDKNAFFSDRVRWGGKTFDDFCRVIENAAGGVASAPMRKTGSNQ